MTERESFIINVRRCDHKDNFVFAVLFIRGVAMLQLRYKDIATGLRISRYTMALWKQGKNLPDPLIRGAVLEWLVQQVQPVLK